MKNTICIYFFAFCLLLIANVNQSQAQTPTQTIKGKIVDLDSKQPLAGATIFLADSTLGIGAMSDAEGNFRLEKVPVGRQIIRAQYLGYENYFSPDVIVTSGKEVELFVQMREQIINEKTVTITAQTTETQAKPINDFSTVSTRSFNIEQVQRYPGTIFDPSRMAMTFPGVTASNDNENAIVIRGNSPVGLVWRLEGMEIVNPNHFAHKGSSGGGITIFSLSLMGQSDFSVGAFAPEYGNAFAGIFDMKFRKGNMEKREFTARAGFIGLDIAAEGPIQKNKSSYLVNYRYSTLALLRKMHINFTGPGTSNVFQDLSFNFAFKTSQNGTLTFFGVGGLSDEAHFNPNDTSKWKSFTDFMQYDFKTKTGATGLTYTHLVDEKSYIKVAVVASGVNIVTNTDTLSKLKTNVTRYCIDNSTEGKYGASFLYNRKFNARLTLKTGIYANRLFYNVFTDRLRRFSSVYDTITYGKGAAILIQPYAQFRYRANEKLTIVGGLHSLVHILPNVSTSKTLEPRLSLLYDFSKTQNLTFAYGLHSQILPLGTYFYQQYSRNPDGTFSHKLINTNLKPIRAHHFVMSYNHLFEGNIRLKLEAYFQYLYHLPVANDSSSTYATINDRSGYGQVPLVNKGVGRNMGLDLTFEKFFSNRFFFLFASSVFDAKYKTLEGNWYNTRYNGRFLSSLMLGKEWTFKQKAGTLEASSRIVYNGGQRYTPVDSALSAQTGLYYPIQNQAFTKQVPNYFRIDCRLAYRKSHKHYSSVVSLDIFNILNWTNYTAPTYDQSLGQLTVWGKQASFTPVLSYMVDF